MKTLFAIFALVIGASLPAAPAGFGQIEGNGRGLVLGAFPIIQTQALSPGCAWISTTRLLEPGQIVTTGFADKPAAFDPQASNGGALSAAITAGRLGGYTAHNFNYQAGSYGNVSARGIITGATYGATYLMARTRPVGLKQCSITILGTTLDDFGLMGARRFLWVITDGKTTIRGEDEAFAVTFPTTDTDILVTAWVSPEQIWGGGNVLVSFDR